MKKRSVVVALVACLLSVPAHAKTFVAVLWPMFGPLPAIGLVELAAEIKRMPNVEVETYVHQAWPSLVDDLNRLPPGTRTIVIGYSLGANATANVANNARHVDEIIALQPSMLSWNPDVQGGKVGRYIEVYNPNPLMTFGGMGSKKLVGPNIEYIANNDSHPGAQFNPQFRSLVKTEVAKLSADDGIAVARAEQPRPTQVAMLDKASAKEAKAAARAVAAKDKTARRTQEPARVADNARSRTRMAERPAKLAENRAAPAAKAAPPIRVADNEAAPAPAATRLLQPASFTEPSPRHGTDTLGAFLDTLSNAVNSGDLSAGRKLTPQALMDYARRTYRVNPGASASAQPVCSAWQSSQGAGCSGVLIN